MIPTKDACLSVVEVPLELRGLPDDEIIRRSESLGTRHFRNRPSKRERLRRKLEQENAQMRKIASEYGAGDAKPQDRPASTSTAGRVLKSAFCGKMGFSFKAKAVESPAEKAASTEVVKRGRGRPRKNP